MIVANGLSVGSTSASFFVEGGTYFISMNPPGSGQSRNLQFLLNDELGLGLIPTNVSSSGVDPVFATRVLPPGAYTVKNAGNPGAAAVSVSIIRIPD